MAISSPSSSMYIFHLQSWKGKSCWWEQAASRALTKQFAADADAAAFSADNAAVLVYKATAQPRGRPAVLAAWLHARAIKQLEDQKIRNCITLNYVLNLCRRYGSRPEFKSRGSSLVGFLRMKVKKPAFTSCCTTHTQEAQIWAIPQCTSAADWMMTKQSW